MVNPLVLAAIPAFLGSLFLMSRGGAGPAQTVQQTVAFVLAATLCAVLSRKPVVLTEKTGNALLAVAVVSLVAPLVLSPGDGPRRWIGLGGFRLYVAAVMLPGVLLLLARTVGGSATRPAWPLAALVATAVALAAQPDAAQVTAFTLACLAFLPRAPLPALARVGAGAVLAGATLVAWLRPDPLQPVPYVEGVLTLAHAVGPFALTLSLLALILPLFPLLRPSRAPADYPEAIPLALYYVATGFLAHRGLTPMPLLGFGLGPILGYFAMATLTAWRSVGPRQDGDTSTGGSSGDTTRHQRSCFVTVVRHSRSRKVENQPDETTRLRPLPDP